MAFTAQSISGRGLLTYAQYRRPDVSPGVHACVVVMSSVSGVSIASGAVQYISFSSRYIDTAGFWNTGTNDRVTIPGGVHWVECTLQVVFQGEPVRSTGFDTDQAMRHVEIVKYDKFGTQIDTPGVGSIRVPPIAGDIATSESIWLGQRVELNCHGSVIKVDEGDYFRVYIAANQSAVSYGGVSAYDTWFCLRVVA